MTTRQEICTAASAKLAAARPADLRALVGLDGFVDEIIQVVDKRITPTTFKRMDTISEFSRRIAAAAGQSSNYELVVTQQKLGGNGPIMANALAAIGLAVTYLGSVGYPDLHPVFQPMTRHATVLGITEPGHTDALEFLDGKIMLGKLATLHEVCWKNLVERIGLPRLRELFGQSSLIGMVNWTMLTEMTDIWEHLLTDILPQLPPGPRTFFVDLADPEKRNPDDLRGALGTLTRFQKFCDVTLGLNLKEAMQVVAALALPPAANPEADLPAAAAAIRGTLGLHAVVIHPRKGAAAATANETAWFAGPFTEHPKISTGAGDHFNAGFVAARLMGLSLAEALCAGTGTSGYYVRNAASPTVGQLAEFVCTLPEPEA